MFWYQKKKETKQTKKSLIIKKIQYLQNGKLISKLHYISICINNLTMLIILYNNLVYGFFKIYFAQLFILSIKPFLYFMHKNCKVSCLIT